MTGAVTSADGTVIGYRQLGQGPGVVLVHGSMQASQNFMKLAQALAGGFTVYVFDRRGRGLSGPHSEHHRMHHECDDLDAVLTKTGARNVFALSGGAVVALEAALRHGLIDKLALYEPPLPLDPSVTAWIPRYDRELAQGKLASAFVTLIKGTEGAAVLRFVPRWVLVPLMSLALRAEATEIEGDDVCLRDLIPTMHFDARNVVEMQETMETTLERCRGLSADVLLLGGSKSPAYLKAALDALGAVLPHAHRTELKGVGHLAADNGGKPEFVARELQHFFDDSSGAET